MLTLHDMFYIHAVRAHGITDASIKMKIFIKRFPPYTIQSPPSFTTPTFQPPLQGDVPEDGVKGFFKGRAVCYDTTCKNG